MRMFEPIIKWSGSKRSQAEAIVSFFPKKIDTYYEPFCGGASVLRKLLSSGISVKRYVCSDINDGLIALWNCIKDKPYDVAEHYRMRWEELNALKTIDEKRRCFTKVRELYNKTHNPLDFMFIMRTATNGMPRYNASGEFNSAYHITRDGIHPDRLSQIIIEWNAVLNSHNVEFVCCPYSDIVPNANDFVYLDPPYANTKGVYYGAIDFNALWDWMNGLKCGYALSFDGISGNSDNTYEVPRHLYDKHEYIVSGNSSFNRLFVGKKDCIVYESIYLKGCGRHSLF